MKALIVCYSYSGNTYRVAQAIQQMTQAELCQIFPPSPGGAPGPYLGGHPAQRGVIAYAPWDNTNTIQKNQEFYNPDAAKIAKDCTPELDFIHYAGPHMPPLFIWHNRYDKFVPAINPVMIAGKMIEYGRPFELHIFQGGEHGMSVCNNLLVITPSSLF